jgi:hypothetical protein
VGRQIKRVPLDFDWPLETRWDGFVNPHWRKCPNPDCRHGSTIAGDMLENIVHLILVAGSDAAKGGKKLHPWIREIGCGSYDHIEPKMAELSTGLAGREPSFFGHDACDRWSAAKKVIQAAGLPDNWGTCPTCDGHGIDPAVREAYEAWEPTEPPAGDGWQVWETVTEGSPISPVFASDAGLIAWLVGQGYSLESATAFAKSGWVPSMVTKGGVIYQDIESAKLQKEKE